MGSQADAIQPGFSGYPSYICALVAQFRKSEVGQIASWWSLAPYKSSGMSVTNAQAFAKDATLWEG